MRKRVNQDSEIFDRCTWWEDAQGVPDKKERRRRLVGGRCTNRRQINWRREWGEELGTDEERIVGAQLETLLSFSVSQFPSSYRARLGFMSQLSKINLSNSFSWPSQPKTSELTRWDAYQTHPKKCETQLL